MMMTVPPTVKAANPEPVPAPGRALPEVRRWSALLAIGVKDLVETGLVAPICWTAAALLYTYYFYTASRQAWGSNSDFVGPFLIFDTFILGSLPVGCAIVGFVLALAQYRTQRSFEAWALLVHRPVTRTEIFFFKTLIGLILYSFTAGLPVVCFLIWAIGNPIATPVFHWRFLLPYAADLLLGVCAYLAGAVLAQRQATLAGTKWMPAAAVVAIGWADTNWVHFSSVAALEMVTIGILAAAAWGQALAHGERTALRSWARGATLLILAAGCWLPAVAAGWSAQLVFGEAIRNWQEAYRKIPPPARSSNITPAVLMDGSVGLKVTESRPDPKQPNQSEIVKTQFTTLEGRPLPEAQELELSQDLPPGSQMEYSPPKYRWYSSILWPYYSNAPQLWYYYLHECTLCGIDQATRKISGSLGPSGYRD